MTFTFDMETWFKITTRPLTQTYVYVKNKQIHCRTNWRVYLLWTGFFSLRCRIVSWPLTWKLHSRSIYTPFDHRHSMYEVWVRLDQAQRICDTDNNFLDNSVMTLTWKLSLRSLHIFYLQAICRYSARLDQGERRNVPVKLSRTDGTDRQTNCSL